jgi:hypothetical protein
MFVKKITSSSINMLITSSKTFACNARAVFVVLLYRDPNLFKRRQRSKNRSAYPRRVLAFWRRDNPDLHCTGRKRHKFLTSSVNRHTRKKQTFLFACSKRSVMPGNIVLPPVNTTLPYSSHLRSMSHIMIELQISSCTGTLVLHVSCN